MKSGKSAKAPQKRNADATRAKILQAALTEFSERGLPEASTDAIAERCGVNKRMIYYYFGSKEGLYLSALESVFENWSRSRTRSRSSISSRPPRSRP